MSQLTPASNSEIVITARPPADYNPAAVYLASLGERSRRVQRQALDSIAALVSSGQHDALTFPWHELGYQHVQAVRTALKDTYSAATANRMLAALRRTLQECWRLGYLSAEEYQRAADVQNVKGETIPAGRGLGSGEIGALMGACGRDASAAGARDAAMIAMLYGSGLRRAEIVSLHLADYDAESGQLIIRGKGNKQRTAYLPEGAAAAFADWLRIRGTEAGPLFCPIDKSGRLQCQDKALTSQAVYNMLQKRAKEAGVKHFSPHDLRRSFVSDMLERGADIATVQRMAGHASPVTTSRYDRRGEQAKQRAAALLHVPYTAR